ncbi:MAG: hypothetical protein FWH16_03875 [Oscillospiraceae bacterium]|nr:hypothetical protein [Oscillospiraceae bacterium]
MKITEVFFTELSKADYNALCPKLRVECSALLRKLRRVGGSLGIPLENKNGRDLRGYYKLYFDKARHRIIYTIADEKIEITAVGETLRETLEITGIGKRDREYIYELISQRISEINEI